MMKRKPSNPSSKTKKSGRTKAPYQDAYARHASVVDSPTADFDIARLSRQIGFECVYPSAWAVGQRGVQDHTVWGDMNPGDYNYCVGLMSRVESYLFAPEFAPVNQLPALDRLD